MQKLAKISKMTDQEMLKYYRLILQSDNQEFIADEAIYLISMLQVKLDRTKVENYQNITRLSDQIEHIQGMERFKNF